MIQPSDDRFHAAAGLINKHADLDFSPCSSSSDETEPNLSLSVLATCIKQSNVDCMITRAYCRPEFSNNPFLTTKNIGLTLGLSRRVQSPLESGPPGLSTAE